MSYEAFRLMVQGWASAGYLPEILAYGFVVNAVLAGLLIGPVLGGLGTLVVVKRFAFFSEAVGHAALTGVAIGILLGEPYTGPYGSLFGYCLLFGISLNYLRNRTGLAPDTLIGVFLSVSLALGASLLLILAGKINVHILENVLFGSVLTVNGNDLLVLAIVGALVLGLSLPLYNRIMLASFNPQLAAVRGVAVKTLDYLFVILVTLITVAAVKVSHSGGRPAGDSGGGGTLAQPVAQRLFLDFGIDRNGQHVVRNLAAYRVRPAHSVRRGNHSGGRYRFRPRSHRPWRGTQPEREYWINVYSTQTDSGTGHHRPAQHPAAGGRHGWRRTAANPRQPADYLRPGPVAG